MPSTVSPLISSSQGQQGATAGISVSIPNAERRKESGASRSFVVFEVRIEVADEEGCCRAAWSVHRRYSEFRALHGSLRRVMPVAQLPHFPPRSMMGSTSASFIRARRASLEKFLVELFQAPLVRRAVQALHIYSFMNPC